MRRIVFLTLAALSVLPRHSAAQDTPRFGVVMGYPAAVGVLWNVSDRVAVRPEINWSRTSVETTSSLNLPLPAPIDSFTTSGSVWAFGIGVSGLWYVAKGDALRTYVSPRFTYTRSTTTIESPVVPVLGAVPAPARTTTTVTPSYGASGSIGAQYSFAKRFGVFGEVGVAYSRGTSSSSPSSVTQTETTNTSVGLRSGAGVILFFGS